MAEEIKNETTLENEAPVVDNAQKEDVKENQPSVEEQLQKALVEIAKLKKATDKATSEASNYKKQLREKQSADEIALQEKAEREAEREEKFNQLLRENEIHKLEKNFLLLGYTDEQANKSATAQYDGDTDTLFKIQSEVQQSLIKTKEAEWLKSRPAVNAGQGSEQEVDPFIQGFGFSKN